MLGNLLDGVFRGDSYIERKNQKMIKKNLCLLVLGLVVVLILTVSLNTLAVSKVISFSHVGSEETPRHPSALIFKERVEAMSNGDIKAIWEPYPEEPIIGIDNFVAHLKKKADEYEERISY